MALLRAARLAAVGGDHAGAREQADEVGRRGGLARVRPQQWRLFQITGLDKVFTGYRTVAEAVAAGRTSSLS